MSFYLIICRLAKVLGSRSLVLFVGGVSLLAAFLSGCQALQIAAVSPKSAGTVELSPTITSQPANASVTVDNSATFSVIATGTATLTYQWQQISTNIPGATSSTYTTPATTAGNSGSTFDVVVSNAAGSVTSNSATLLVTAPVVAAPAQASYYVALNGSDTADGSASSPFATLQRAQLAM